MKLSWKNLGSVLAATALCATLASSVRGLASADGPQDDAETARRELAAAIGVNPEEISICSRPQQGTQVADNSARARIQNDSVIDTLFGSDPALTAADATEPLRAPLEYRSSNGRLDVVLVAQRKTITVKGFTLQVAVYNGEYAGPVLRVKPGDHLHVKLINQLDQSTNMHFHGMSVSPLAHGDNVAIVIPPGQTADYEIDIPKDHRPGSYWYHSHIHGFSERQVMAGLSGSIIVEDANHVGPDLTGLREQLLVLKNFQASPSGAIYRVLKAYRRDLRTVNGQLMPRIDMRPGETQVWRFSNQAADLNFRLRLPGMQFHVVNVDGNPVTTAVVTDELIIPNAARVDVMVTAPSRGDVMLVSERTNTGPAGDDFREQNLALVHVSGEPVAQRPLPDTRVPQRDLKTAHIDAYRDVVFTEESDSSKFYVNGRSFDHSRTDFRIPLGNTEEWTIQNSTDELHVFHIHQTPFQVISVNGVPQPLTSYQDSILVPIWGKVVVRLAFTDPNIVGRFMFHCHILEHEDKGMMAVAEVYDPKASSANGMPR